MLFKRIRSFLTVEDPQTLWNPAFIMILVFGFISGTAGQMVNPQLSSYAKSLGASLSLAGTIVGMTSMMAMFLRPISGAANDVLNRKYVMVGSILISSLSYAGYMIFPSIAGMIVSRLLQGFSFAFMSVARISFATSFIPKDRMGEGVALTSFGVVLSQAVGPAIGLWLSDRFGYNICFLISNILCISGAVVLSVLPYKHIRGEFHIKKLKLNNLIAVEILPYAFLAGLFSISTQMANSFLALIAKERVIPGVAIFFTVYSIIALTIRPIAGRILDRFGLPVLLYPAFIFNSLTFLLIGAANSITVIVLAGICKALSQGVALASIQGASIKRLGRERAGVSSATIHIGQDLLNTMAPAAGGFLATGIGYGNTFYSFAAFVLIGIPLYIWLRRSEKKRDANLADKKPELVA